MKFEKIIIPPGWKDSFTKYPNGRTIFEALSHSITSVNEGIEEVNQKVDQGLLAIDQAENTIRQEITESFNTLKLQLEGEIDDLSSDLISDFALLQSDVITLIDDKADKTYVDAQLAEKVNKAQEAWITPSLVNGATHSGRPLQYRLNEIGQLEFRGELSSAPSVLATTIFSVSGKYLPKTNNGGIVSRNNAFARVQLSLLGNFNQIAGATTGALNVDGLTINVG